MMELLNLHRSFHWDQRVIKECNFVLFFIVSLDIVPAPTFFPKGLPKVIPIPLFPPPSVTRPMDTTNNVTTPPKKN